MKDNDNLVEILHRRALQSPHKIIYTFLEDGESQEKRITYKELDDKAQAIAHQLKKLTQPGERAILLYLPGLDYITALFGCLYAGVIAVPTYPPFNKIFTDKLQAIITNSEPTLILSTQKLSKKIHWLGYIKWAARFSLKIKQLTAWDFDRIKWQTTDNIKMVPEGSWQSPLIKLSDIAYLQYTSGSTADPKGVMISHGNLMANLREIRQFFPPGHSHRGVSWLPPYHDMGLVGGIFTPLHYDFPAILMSPMHFLKKPLRWLHAISKYHATISAAPDFSYALCVKKITAAEKVQLNLNSLRITYNGAESLRPETYHQFLATFKDCGFRETAMCPAYGLAEGTLIVSINSPHSTPTTLYLNRTEFHKDNIVIQTSEENAVGLVCCGKPVTGTHIVNPDTHDDLPENKIGEIWISGNSVSPGYWNNPKSNSELFDVKINSYQQQHFCRTGDLGFIHQGNLYVSGRIKDLIILRGMKYHPQDIEYSVAQSHPHIRPGCVAAFSIQGERQECLVILVEIIPKTPPEKYADIYQAILQTTLKNHGLAIHKIALLPPKSILKTGTGKIQRQANKLALKRHALALIDLWEKPEIDKSRPSNLTKNNRLDIYQIVKQLVAAKTGLINIDDDSDLRDIGINSLILMELQNELYQKFPNVGNVNNEDFFSHLTIKKLSEWIWQQSTTTVQPSQHDHVASLSAKNQPVRMHFPINRIFLTGASGVLGGHLLKTLLKESALHIYCLVRGSSPEERWAKLQSILVCYDEPNLLSQFKDRVTIIPGDIIENKLGLSSEAWQNLTQNIDCVLHAAGNVALHESYEKLEKVNVVGARNVVDFSLNTPNKYLIHISTYAIMGDRLLQNVSAFTENDFQLGQGFSGLNYAKSKFNAELLVREAKNQGLNWIIIRPGNIFGEATTGSYPFSINVSGIFYDILKTVITTKIAMNTPLYFDITPVDYISKAIQFFMLDYQDCFNVFHLLNPDYKKFNAIVEMIKEVGHDISLVPPNHYYFKLLHSPHSFLSDYRSLMLAFARLHPNLFKSTGASTASAENTTAILATHSIFCPKIDSQLINTYLQYCRKVGYLP